MAKRSNHPSLPGFEPDVRQQREAAERAAEEAAAAKPGAPVAEGPLEAVPLTVADPAEPPPESLAGQTVWVIDAHSLIHQVFHALPEMTGPRGEPVGAIFGFMRDLVYLLEEKHPDFLFCAFDMPGPTFRHTLYEDYKLHRPPMHEDLAPQIPSIGRAVTALGVANMGVPSFEADDLLATVARVTEELGGECMLVTADKDCRQLITDRVKLYNIRKDEVFDRDRLREDWGIRPDQVVDFQSLVGDSVDNVPGVPLIGPKLARQLLEQYDTLEGVLDHAHEVSGTKRRENLVQYRDQALLSRELVRLDAHVPIAIDWTAGRVGRIDRDAALQLCREFGFRSLGQKLEHFAPARRSRDAVGCPPQARPAAAGASADAPAPFEEDSAASTAMTESLGVSSASPAFVCHLVDTPEVFQHFLAELRRQPCFSFDTETTHIWPRWAELVGLALAWNNEEAWYLPLRAPADEPRLDAAAVLTALRPILEDPAVEKIGQNLKYDMIVLRGAGIRLSGLKFDSMIASYLLEAGERNHNLDELAKRYLGHTTIKIEELIGSGKKQKRMDEVSARRVADYAGEDAMIPLRLRPILEEQLRRAGLMELFLDVELLLVEVLVELEFTGIRVDVEFLGKLSERFGERMELLEQQIYDMAGRPVNIDSPKQLQQLLFNELKLPVVKKTAKTGPSTDAEVLEELARVHPLPAKIMEYRQFGKLQGTYVDALPRMVHPQTGRVHASFHQAVAATGRLSSSDPNLQNIPVRTEEGREIRAAFIPGDTGWEILCADYSQIELRVLAHFAEDENLRAAFARDEDIHARVASQINGVPLTDVTSAMRREAKAVNFGVIYGQSAFGLARALGIEKDAAARFIESYFGGYPGIEEFLARVLNDCRKQGYVSTILGRRRAIRGVRPDAGRQRNLPERTAINTVIQGSAADLIKLAMLRVHRRMQEEAFPGRMLLQIHDELVFEVPAAQRDRLARMVAAEMVAVYPLSVPLKVDVKAGFNWAAAEELQIGP
ncbi:MAG: DNA polymerase I [Planctomycetota bacterium]